MKHPFSSLAPVALAPLVALTASAVGCGPSRARSFAVVLEETEAARCLASSPFDPGDLTGFEDAWSSSSPSPTDPAALDLVGGTLRVAPSDEGGAAWFEDLADPSHRTWNGAVLEGEVADDHLEVKGAGTFDLEPPEADGSAPECRLPARFEAEMVVTIDGPELDGMLWRTEQRPLAVPDLACIAGPVCAREIRVTGVEDR